MRIHPETRIGAVHYTVRDLNRQVDFYRDILGFHLLWCDGDTAALGTKTRELLRLTENPSAPAPGRTTGLYHTAFLVPTKWELAHLVNRVIETRTPVQGHSNHGTHLALYLPDPEGNGIELAWDFPKEQWPMKDGVIRFEDMPREGIDLEALLSELDKDPSPWNGLSDETVVGHVHLHVSHLDETRAFYRDLLGFDITIEGEHLGGCSSAPAGTITTSGRTCGGAWASRRRRKVPVAFAILLSCCPTAANWSDWRPGCSRRGCRLRRAKTVNRALSYVTRRETGVLLQAA